MKKKKSNAKIGRFIESLSNQTRSIFVEMGMGVRKGTVVSFVPTLFGCFLGIPSLRLFMFFYVFCDMQEQAH